MNMDPYRPEELLAVLTRLFVLHPNVTLIPDGKPLIAIMENGEQVGVIDLVSPRDSALPQPKDA